MKNTITAALAILGLILLLVGAAVMQTAPDPAPPPPPAPPPFVTRGWGGGVGVWAGPVRTKHALANRRNPGMFAAVLRARSGMMFLVLRLAQNEESQRVGGLALSLSTLLRPPKWTSRRRQGEGAYALAPLDARQPRCPEE